LKVGAIGDVGLSSSSIEKNNESCGILRVTLRLLRVGDSGSTLALIVQHTSKSQILSV
jgi:hypothetical protein